ncbi:MAG: hypothetical protein AAF723_03915 [Pseudomonadota bacterium]
MNLAQTVTDTSLAASGMISADPTVFIAFSWGLSALILGGLVVYALVTYVKKRL